LNKETTTVKVVHFCPIFCISTVLGCLCCFICYRLFHHAIDIFITFSFSSSEIPSILFTISISSGDIKPKNHIAPENDNHEMILSISDKSPETTICANSKRKAIAINSSNRNVQPRIFFFVSHSLRFSEELVSFFGIPK